MCCYRKWIDRKCFITTEQITVNQSEESRYDYDQMNVILILQRGSHCIKGLRKQHLEVSFAMQLEHLFLKIFALRFPKPSSRNRRGKIRTPARARAPKWSPTTSAQNSKPPRRLASFLSAPLLPPTSPPFLPGTLSYGNQGPCANFGNSNIGHRINI